MDAVVKSNGLGHASGVVIGPNKFVTARHFQGGTFVGMEVFIILKNGVKFITKVTKKTTPDFRISTAKLAPEAKLDRYWYGDICICETEDSFPIDIPLIGNPKIIFSAVHKDGTVSQHTFHSKMKNWLFAAYSHSNGTKFAQGDSGLPWFSFNKSTGKWETVGITSRVSRGPSETPWAAESPRLNSLIRLNPMD